VQYFALNLTAVSPVAIRADYAPGGVTNARYIAGSSLLGSLAAVYRLFHADRVTDFERLFLSEQVQYPNLYPATFGSESLQDAWELPVYPVPQTARTCKRFPGFLFQGESESYNECHGVRDSLFDWAIFKLASAASDARPTELLELLQDQKTCSTPTCKRAMKSFSGFYRRGESWNQPMLSATPRTRVQTHTGINRETGTVQEGILYSRQVFNEQTRFWGMAKVPDELAAPFVDFLNQVGKSGLVRVGTGRSRGLGKVHLDAQPLSEERYGFVAFKQRLETFHDRFCEKAQAVASTLRLDPFYFALTLHAPVILRDALLRYRSSISEETLAELLELPADSFRAIYQTTSTTRVAGWNELWGTPRLNEYALETSSVFFFASLLRPDEALLRALFRLEQEGIGQRRTEGFGRVCISDPFHLEVKLR